MIQINNLSKSFNNIPLFEQATFSIQKGEKCGLVGRNGTGKSTLFKIVLGVYTPDEGDISFPKNYKIAHLEQHINFSMPSVLKECLTALPENLQDQSYLAEKYLSGLGFTDKDMEKDPKSFSGGYQIRINLVKCLLQEPNLLLLDEPTNYLDIVSLRWLANFLKNYPGEVILITHDRFFMDQVIDHTIGIHRGKLRKIKGQTQKFYEQIALDEEIYEKTRVNIDKKKAQLQTFIDKNKAKASKASQAQSKIKQLERLGTMDKLLDEQDIKISFAYKEISSKNILNVNNLSFGYPGKETLIENLSFSIQRGEKVAIVGKNGKGKSTLLNLIANELDPNHGEISFHNNVTIGHLGQTNVNRLSGNATIVEEISSENSELGNTGVRNICGALMFTGDQADKKISVLSGGEKNRVLMGKIMAKKTNLLLLDEPTNHLDMQSIEILTKEIQDYPGSVLLVTHSEELLRKAATNLIVFHNDKVEFFHGNYDHFLEKIGWGDTQIQETKTENGSGLSKKERHQKRQEIIKEKSKILNPLKKEYDKNEEELFNLEETLEELNLKMEEATNTNDQINLMEASKKIGLTQSKIDEVLEKVSTLEEEIHTIEEGFQAQLNELEW